MVYTKDDVDSDLNLLDDTPAPHSPLPTCRIVFDNPMAAALNPNEERNVTQTPLSSGYGPFSVDIDKNLLVIVDW